MSGVPDGRTSAKALRWDSLGISQNAKKTNTPGSWLVCLPKRLGSHQRFQSQMVTCAKKIILAVGGEQNGAAYWPELKREGALATDCP